MSERRLRVELIAAVVLAAVSLLTIVWPDWLEGTIGIDPDAGSGAVEAGIVVVLALAALGLALHRRARLRQLRARVTPGHDT
jgi:hypothetical protein